MKISTRPLVNLIFFSAEFSDTVRVSIGRPLGGSFSTKPERAPEFAFGSTYNSPS